MQGRWSQIEDLYHKALQQPENRRDAFLTDACAGDEELRREIQSLFGYQSKAERLMENRALDLAAQSLAKDSGRFSKGQQIGSYEVLALLGAGNMGQVYRARDSRLKRDVAIKVLPLEFSADTARVLRLRREAEVLASLNHPNIAAIYDFEEWEGSQLLVMELVEGETLADRIARGPVPLDQSLEIAQQIAEALEAAHEQGVIHRDLKPANIKVKPDGIVKVLDFGLAKVMQSEGGSDATGGMSLSQAGMILGTALYMSPEQASGRRVDRRTDIWAFGVVHYELVTGTRPFTGGTIQEIIASVLTSEPPFDAVPSGVRPLIEKCLRKDARKRWQAIGEVRLAIEEGLEAAPSPSAAVRPSRVPWLIAAVFLLAFAIVAATYFRETTPNPQIVRFGVPIPGGSATEPVFALSPDGKHLAITAPKDGSRDLWVRPIDSLEMRLIPGTADATSPFWSPDGAEVGFFAQGRLKKVPIAGGSPITLATNANANGGSMNREGVIIFSSQGTLRRVDRNGGNAIPVLQSESLVFNGPEFLPDGRHFLYIQQDRQEGGERNGIYVGSLDGTDPVRILPDVSKASYAPSASGDGQGYLLFRRAGLLMAQPFDPDTLALSGLAIPLSNEKVPGRPQFGPIVLFSTSANGLLAYQTVVPEQLVWVDRAGAVVSSVGPPGEYANFRLSPDQSKIAMDIQRFDNEPSARDVATIDLGRGVLERLTLHEDADLIPVWSPDGNQQAFSSFRYGEFDLFVTSASGQEQLLMNMKPKGGWATDWYGDFVLWDAGGDIWVVPLTKGQEQREYVKSPAKRERGGQFSRDGRWVAYSSDESGQEEIHIQSFPPGRRFIITGQGGKEPAWRKDGRELFYVAGDGKLTALPITLGETSIVFGKPQSLFTAPVGTFRRNYEVSLDGQRFLIATPTSAGGASITVVLNWQAALVSSTQR